MRPRGRPLAVVLGLLVSLCLVGIGFGSQALAQEDRVAVRLDGRTVFRVGPSTELEAEERAARIEQRLNRLLQNPTAISPAQIEAVAPDDSSRLISVAGIPIVTVTTEDAQEHFTSVEALAIQWAQSLDAALGAASARRLSPGARLLAEVQAAVVTSFARLAESALIVVPRALAALLVIGLFWAIASLVRWTVKLVFRLIGRDPTIENLVKQAAYYTVWGLGLLVATDALGFDPETVIAGLGLTGLALGFALKDVLSNFVSGLIILSLRPFRIGDQIVVGPTEGGVERIDLRATQIRTYDGRLVIVPNAELLTSRVVNNTASPVRRGSVTLPLAYDSDLRLATQIIADATQATEGVLGEPETTTRVRELGANQITVEARFWTDSRRSDFLATTSAVQAAVVGALRQAGIALPDPSKRSLEPARSDQWCEILRNGDAPVRAERADRAMSNGDS